MSADINQIPPYPEGEVVGACVCGSWPGGKCMRCPVRQRFIRRYEKDAVPESPAIAMQEVDAERWRAVRDYLASTRSDLDDDFLEACSSADTLLLCAFADNLILQSQQSPVQASEPVNDAARRYEIVRKMNVPQFQALYKRNIAGEGRFDDLVDQFGVQASDAGKQG